MPIDFAKAYTAFSDAKGSAEYVNNTECVKSMYNSLYWKAIDAIGADEDNVGLYLFLGIAIGAVFVIAIILLVIYFKNRKTDETTETTEKLTP
jgi:hypothetical protein